MRSTLRSIVALLVLGISACEASDAPPSLDGTWAWRRDGGCSGPGERTVIDGDEIRWFTAHGMSLGGAAVKIEWGFSERDRLQHWTTLEYVRDGHAYEDRFIATDRLGELVLELASRTVDNERPPDSPRERDSIARCDG